MRFWLWAAGLAGAATLVSCASDEGRLGGAGPGDGSAHIVGVSLDYPNAPAVDQVDVIHGERVMDPYRWMEDPNLASTKAWVKAQNEISFGFLEQIDERGAIRERLTGLQDYERFGTPNKKGGRYFYSRNDGLQDQSVLYVAESLNARPRTLLDPNALSDEGTVSLSSYSVSDDGSMLAYGVSRAGSDWIEFFVRDVETGRDLEDHIKWAKFTGASWTKDGRGFYYSRYDEPSEDEKHESANYFQKLYFHEVGTPQSEDRLVYERPDKKEWGFGGSVTEDGAYLVINVWEGTSRKNGVFYKDLRSPGGEIVELLNDFDAQYSFIANTGPTFYFTTDLDAPMQRVIAIDIRNPDRSNWETIIPETDNALRGVGAVGGRFVASYLTDARSQVEVFDLTGELVREVELPGIGSAGGFGGRMDDTETFYSFSSFTNPGAIYRYDVATGESELFRAPDVDFDSEAYTTRQVFVRSKDGTRVPMFLVHKKDFERTGDAPTLLYGYGGFNIPITPSFSVSRIAWLEMGGVYAVANLRGGGEYGKEWHDAGRLLDKQNVFDDFIAAGEYLIRENYTSSSRLAISGRSNGGLLVGACMTQRPDLWGACLPGVGVMDMLRFHLFTIGWAWVSDYGKVEEENHFRNLLSYSPLHNIREGVCYPPTLITTADTDDRVVPAHSFKFAQTLQDAQGCENPILIRIETSAGHGAGKPTSKRIEEQTDELAFLAEIFEMNLSEFGD